MGGFAPKKVEKLTDEHRKLVEDNHNLIYKVLYDKHLDIDEWYGVAALALCKAAMLFDPDKKIQFSTYACAAIWNNICNQYALSIADRQIPKDKIYSLDCEYGTGEEAYTIKDYYADDYSFEDDILTRERFAKGLNRFKNPRDRSIVVMASEGYTYEKIGHAYGISRERVRQIIKRYAFYIGYKLPKGKGFNRRGE